MFRCFSFHALKIFKIQKNINTNTNANTADPALIQTLQSELKYESEAKADEEQGVPEFLKAFQEQGLWQVRFLPFF